MTWHRLIALSLTCASVSVGVIATVGPKQASAETASCGAHSGTLCWKHCDRECSNGSCCEWTFYYFNE